MSISFGKAVILNKETYLSIESYMLACMQDSAHDCEHIYRVLYTALDIAQSESSVRNDILIAACLLHDIGRDKQYVNPAVCHAQAGGEMAFAWLTGNGWTTTDATDVQNCISTHCFRSDRLPESIEAKILFDADKLDACGLLGISRTLLYQGQVGEPLYRFDADGNICTNCMADSASFFEEYNFKLKRVYGSFYTVRAKQLALHHEKAAAMFYAQLFKQVTENRKQGLSLLGAHLSSII